MGAVARIKIYGERNTGTNLLERALAQSCDAFVYPGNAPRWRMTLYHHLRRIGPREMTDRLIEADRDRFFIGSFARNLGWKHARVPVPPPPGFTLPEDLGFVTLRKNPYSWLLSLHKRAYAGSGRAARTAAPFETFLDMPWSTVRRECGPPVYPSPTAIWCDKVASYAALDAIRPTVHLRYEDLLADPAAALRAVEAGLGVHIRAEAADFATPTKGDAGSFEGYRSYYLEEKWRAKLTPAVVARINADLDPDLVTRMGYALIAPSDIAA